MIERGILYYTGDTAPDDVNFVVTSNPGHAANVIQAPAATGGGGEYRVLITNTTLTANYWFRAYAINSRGVSYGAVAYTSLHGTTIHVETEEGGAIVSQNGATINTKGALFWNGTAWVSNDTAAHTYFTDLLTGKRLRQLEDVAAAGGGSYTSALGDTYSITCGEYTYTVPAAAGGSYTYTGYEYRITVTHENEGEGTETDQLVLRSKGVGKGTGSAYFDVFVQVGNSGYVTGIRSDPNWITYPSMTMAQALAAPEGAGTVSGRLASVNADYFMDINGGAEMGGRSYILHTGAFPGAGTHDASALYNTGFALRYLGSATAVNLNFIPQLLSEAYAPAAAGGSAGGGAFAIAPNVQTVSVSGVTASGAILAGRVVSTGGSVVTERGFVIGKAADPSLGPDVMKIPLNAHTAGFTTTVDSLLPATAYYVRAYAVNASGVGYGESIPLTTGFVGDGKNAVPKTGDSVGFVPLLLCGAAVAAGVGITLRRSLQRK